MINLLKADLFRLRKSKTFKNSMIVMGILVIAYFVVCSMSEDFISINITFRNDRMYGFYIGRIKDNINYINIFRSSLGFVIFTCLSMIFLVTDSVISRYSNGVLKNMVSYGHNKCKVYLSSLISNYIGVCIIGISYIVFSMIGAIFLFSPEKMISKNELNIILVVTLVVLIILAAMVSLYTLISVILKSKVVISTAAALFMTFGTGALFDVISKAVQNKMPIYMLIDICGQPEISSISHDLRTPLTFIQGYLQMLRKDNLSEEKRKRYIEIADKRSKDLQELLNQFFMLSVVEDPKYKGKLETIDLKEVLVETLTSFYEEFTDKGIEPDIEICSDAINIVGDYIGSKRVLENLMINIARHSKGNVKITLVKYKEKAELRIIDKIQDKDEIDADNLFNKFYKADKARKVNSTGLVLSIVKELMGKMNGNVEADIVHNSLGITRRWELSC